VRGESRYNGFYWCTGSLDEAALAEHKSSCDSTNGTVHEIENVRITCEKTASVSTFTNIEMIPECLPASCTDEKEIKGGVEDYVDGLDEMAEMDGGEGRCIVNTGGDFPHGSGAATVAFAARKAMVGAIFITLMSSVLVGV